MMNDSGFLIEDMNEEYWEMVKQHGYGSVYKNKARNCYQAAFYLLEDGEKKRKIISAPSYAEALLKMTTITSGETASVREENLPTPQVYHTIKDIWNHILNVQKAGIRPSSKRWYIGITKLLIEDLGDTNIEDLTSSDIQKFINKIIVGKNGHPASESKVKKTTEQLKAIVQFALNEGYISKNPFNGNVVRRKGIQNDPRDASYSLNEVEAILKKLKHAESIVLRTAIPALLLTGMRIGEFLTLGYSDLDRDKGMILIRHSIENRSGVRVRGITKTEAGHRTIPVPPIFFDIIDNWQEYVVKNSRRVQLRENQDVIFCNDRGEIRNPDTLRSDFNEFLRKNHMKKTYSSFHTLRRTYATLMNRSDVDVETISYLLGHKPDLKDGCSVAREHYIKPDREMVEKKKEAAVQKYMVYMGDIFEKNIHFTHLRKKPLR